MMESFVQLLPLIVLIGIGYLLKVVKILDLEKSKTLFQIVFYITLPATIFIAISKTNLFPELVVLPISAVMIMLVFFIIGTILVKKLNLEEKRGKVILAAMIMLNTAYIGFPLFGALYGEDGIANVALFDLGSIFIAYGLVYWIVSSSKNRRIWGNLKKIFATPVLWALVIALIINIYSIEINESLNGILTYLSGGTTPLVMIAIGGFLHFNIKNKKIVLIVSGVKLIFGLIMGVLIVNLLGLKGLIKNVILMGAILPSAILTIIYSTVEKLDSELAIEIVTVSTIISLIAIVILASIL